MTLKKPFFFNSDFRNGSSYYQLVTLPNFAKFHPQTNEIHSLKAEFFSTKMLEFQHNDVIIFDGIFFGMWSKLVMSYLCAKFRHLLHVIHAFSCIFFVFFYKWTAVSA